MANKVTFTGKIGAGESVSGLVFNNVTALDLDYIGQTATIVMGNVTEVVDIYGKTTISHSITGTAYTVVIS